MWENITVVVQNQPCTYILCVNNNKPLSLHQPINGNLFLNSFWQMLDIQWLSVCQVSPLHTHKYCYALTEPHIGPQLGWKDLIIIAQTGSSADLGLYESLGAVLWEPKREKKDLCSETKANLYCFFKQIIRIAVHQCVFPWQWSVGENKVEAPSFHVFNYSFCNYNNFLWMYLASCTLDIHRYTPQPPQTTTKRTTNAMCK